MKLARVHNGKDAWNIKDMQQMGSGHHQWKPCTTVQPAEDDSKPISCMSPPRRVLDMQDADKSLKPDYKDFTKIIKLARKL